MLLSADNWEFLAEGAVVTLQVTAMAFVVGTALGILGGVLSVSRSRAVRAVVRVYVEVFRGASAIVLLFFAAFALPDLVDAVTISRFQAAVIALGTNMGAYCTELARGAIQAVPQGQTEGAIAVNLSVYQRLRHVILPQALITMLPSYGNLLIEVLKASALVSLVGLDDVMRHANILRNNRVDSTFDIYLAALILYFLIAGVITLGVRAAERSVSRGTGLGRSAQRGAP